MGDKKDLIRDVVKNPVHAVVVPIPPPPAFLSPLINLLETSIIGTPDVTAWLNEGTGGSAYDLSLKVGTPENIFRTTVNSLDCVGHSGSAALKTAAGILIPAPYTAFLVAEYTFSDTGPFDQNLFDARDIGTCQIGTINALNDRYNFKNGSADLTTPATNPYSTFLKLYTVTFTGGADTRFEVSNFADVVADAGSEAWDFATFFNTKVVGFPSASTICQFGLFDSILSNSDKIDIQEFLKQKWNVF